MNFDIKKDILFCAERIERELLSYYNNESAVLDTIFEAQKYSLLAGGKRIRPYLVMSFCKQMGGSETAALPLACAIEMVHTYSLIHDDLPCMDDDDYRRGKLTNHKVYGEATAVLAGDALLTKAFEVISTCRELSAQAKVRAIAVLSVAAGDRGMIGGQTMDMTAQGNGSGDIEYLITLQKMKTGALIRAAAKLGCIAADLEESDAAFVAADGYAERIGLAFQIVDDILDVIGDAKALGKNVGADKEANKLTFVNFYSVEEAKEYVSRLTEEAIRMISPYDKKEELQALARYLADRIY